MAEVEAPTAENAGRVLEFELTTEKKGRFSGARSSTTMTCIIVALVAVTARAPGPHRCGGADPPDHAPALGAARCHRRIS
jgi:hypothetical protein